VLVILDEMREKSNKHFLDMFSVTAIMLNKNKEEIYFRRIAKRQTHRTIMCPLIALKSITSLIYFCHFLTIREYSFLIDFRNINL